MGQAVQNLRKPAGRQLSPVMQASERKLDLGQEVQEHDPLM